MTPPSSSAALPQLRPPRERPPRRTRAVVDWPRAAPATTSSCARCGADADERLALRVRALASRLVAALAPFGASALAALVPLVWWDARLPEVLAHLDRHTTPPKPATAPVVALIVVGALAFAFAGEVASAWLARDTGARVPLCATCGAAHRRGARVVALADALVLGGPALCAGAVFAWWFASEVMQRPRLIVESLELVTTPAAAGFAALVLGVVLRVYGRFHVENDVVAVLAVEPGSVRLRVPTDLAARHAARRA